MDDVFAEFGDVLGTSKKGVSPPPPPSAQDPPHDDDDDQDAFVVESERPDSPKKPEPEPEPKGLDLTHYGPPPSSPPPSYLEAMRMKKEAEAVRQANAVFAQDSDEEDRKKRVVSEPDEIELAVMDKAGYGVVVLPVPATMELEQVQEIAETLAEKAELETGRIHLLRRRGAAYVTLKEKAAQKKALELERFAGPFGNVVVQARKDFFLHQYLDREEKRLAQERLLHRPVEPPRSKRRRTGRPERREVTPLSLTSESASSDSDSSSSGGRRRRRRSKSAKKEKKKKKQRGATAGSDTANAVVEPIAAPELGPVIEGTATRPPMCRRCREKLRENYPATCPHCRAELRPGERDRDDRDSGEARRSRRGRRRGGRTRSRSARDEAERSRDDREHPDRGHDHDRDRDRDRDRRERRDRDGGRDRDRDRDRRDQDRRRRR